MAESISKTPAPEPPKRSLPQAIHDRELMQTALRRAAELAARRRAMWADGKATDSR